ncbi:tropomyosin alpha-4 chain-like [Dendronephthya gigantea]|uniref:tropomyosin alpha-4 chain-like n=1 Tax=Dendronephthya gigantea TaxID=151771 RepID=UPI00106BAE87|nr:tropomyosin alpha-4 chain-like [Dendronephthya gigantea]
MEKVKARINKLKQDIEDCEQQEANAKVALNEAKTRQEAAEMEKESFKRRLQILREEVKKTNERLAHKKELLNGLESKTAEHEIAVKNLENQEVEGDERLASLADQISRGKLEVDGYDTQYQEAQRKEVVLLSDLEKAELRFEQSSLRIEELMDTIRNTTNKIRDLEARESDQTQRETTNEEKMVFLSDQKKEAICRAESGERDTARLQRVIDTLGHDIKHWKDKTADVLAEIEDVNNMVEDMD